MVASDYNIDISITSPICLNNLSKADILNLRTHAVKTSSLFSDMRYRPNPRVFNITDGLPWLSLEGALHYNKIDPQERINGPSRESIGILNPELLYYVTVNENEDAQNDEFKPLYKDCYFIPSKVVYNSKTNTITAYYRNAKLEGGTYQPIFLNDINAHDLGYKYAYMSSRTNVGFYSSYKGNTLRSGIKEIAGFYTHGSACGYPGGCNNSAPYWLYYNYFYLRELPASFNIKLWINWPESVEQEADINFRMVFL